MEGADVGQVLMDITGKIAKLEQESKSLIVAKDRLKKLHKKQQAVAGKENSETRKRTGLSTESSSTKVIQAIARAVKMSEEKLQTIIDQTQFLCEKRDSLERREASRGEELLSHAPEPIPFLDNKHLREKDKGITPKLLPTTMPTTPTSLGRGTLTASKAFAITTFLSQLGFLFLLAFLIVKVPHIFDDVRMFTPV